MSEQNDQGQGEASRPTTRRELLRPLQLLGMAFGAAVLAGVVTAFSLGIAQSPSKPWMSPEQREQLHAQVVSNAWTMALIVAGCVFIAVLLVLSLLLLAVKPDEFGGTVDRPVLYPHDEDADAGEQPDSKNHGGSAGV